MKVLLPFRAMSQYADEIPEAIRSSACGPVTAAAILRHHEGRSPTVQMLYKKLWTTRIGLSAFFLIRQLRKLTGSAYVIERVRSIEQVKQELIAGRPLAVKFDRYFSFRWRTSSAFAYHWTPLVGFEDKDGDVMLYIHDNGQKNRPSKLRAVSFLENQYVVSFIRIVPTTKKAS